MERPWLRHYPPGVAAEIDPSRYPSLVAMFEESFKAHAARDACVCMGAPLSYAGLDAASRQLAAWLQSRGLKRGARVAIMMPNVLQYPVAIVAILRAGLTVVNVNPLYKPRELEFQLNDAGAEAIIVLENFAAVLQQALPRTPIKHVVVARMGDLLGAMKGAVVNGIVRHIKKMVPAYTLPDAVGFKNALALGRDLSFAEVAVGPDDIAFLQYTGGTTGVAKAAMLLHRNLIANVLQVEAWHTPLARGAATGRARDDPYRAAALSYLCTDGVLPVRRARRRLMSPDSESARHPIAHQSAHQKSRERLSGGKHIVQRAAAPSRLRQDRLEHAQIRGRRRHGGAEVGRRCLGQGHRPSDYRRLRLVGNLAGAHVQPRRYRGMDRHHRLAVALDRHFDPRRCRAMSCHPARSGEICARGPQVMPGYWQRPDETANAMTSDGFFRTGDIGVMDEQGRVTIVDRKKDMITVSGFKVFPNEVEEFAMSHGGILECAVVGVPDAHSGEVPKLFAVKKQPGRHRSGAARLSRHRPCSL